MPVLCFARTYRIKAKINNKDDIFSSPWVTTYGPEPSLSQPGEPREAEQGAPPCPRRPDSWKIASALCARHIGGAVNYVGVVETLGVSPASQVQRLAPAPHSPPTAPEGFLHILPVVRRNLVSTYPVPHKCTR